MPWHNFTHSNDTALGIKSLICTVFRAVFPGLTLLLHSLIIFRVYVIETKLDFVSFDDKNLQTGRNFAGKRDFPL